MADPITVSAVLGLGGKLVDKLFPDPTAKAEAQAKLAMMAQDGELEEMRIGMSAIVMEAQSSDPWTSRARPSFLYVMYTMILFGIPFGFLHAFDPAIAAKVSTGLKAWLDAIPTEMWYLFGAGYLGYASNRSMDKAIQAGHAPQRGLLGKLLG